LTVDARLLDYYNRELRYLRELGGEFADAFPKIASRLGLDSFECADPYVERLLEGFAFLTARIQLQLDDEFPRFSEQLLGLLCPHYLAPTPSMAVVELAPDEKQPSLNGGVVVPRGTAIRATLQRPEATCEYRTAHDVTLWPLQVAGLSVSAGGPSEVDFASAKTIRGTVRLRLKSTVALSQLPLDELTLYLRGADPIPWRLFELMSAGVAGMATFDPQSGAWTRLAAGKVRPIGRDDGESLLPVGSRTFQGYRLLSEYFAFPARFLFVRLSGLSPGVRACKGDVLDVVLGLDHHDPGLESAATPSLVSLFCTPAANLFPKKSDRVPLVDGDREYHVVPDRAHPLDFEVHTVTSVTGYGARGEIVSEFAPFYRRRHADDPLAPAAFFTVQRRGRLSSSRQRSQGTRSSYVGSEVFVSLVDGSEGPFRGDIRQLAVETLCTNRDLPLIMPIGPGKTKLVLEAGAPVSEVRCVTGPSSPRPPQAVGEATWRLISHLALNFLSLSNTSEKEGASALRELLTLYADLSDRSARRQIAGVLSMATRPIVRRVVADGPPTFARGTEVSLRLDESSFEGTSAFVLGLVLSNLFARYASINSFVETVVRTDQRGEIARWPAIVGLRATL